MSEWTPSQWWRGERVGQNYDGFGRLVSLGHFQDPLEPLARYTWTYEGGGAAEITSPESQAESPFGFGGGFGLDALLASSSTEVSVDPLADHVWSFDAAFTGRLAQMTSADGVSDYSYDARGQLVGAIYDYQDAEAYTYDANGNRTNGGYATGDHNRLLSDGTYAYEYDAEGNRTTRTNLATDQVTEYEWDHRNRLIEVVERARDHGPILQSVEYVYDSQNRWIAKSLDPDGPGHKPSTDTHFVYDGNQIVLQLDDTGSVTNRNLWGPMVDQILADETVDEVLWPLTDHLNTVRDLATYNPDTSQTTIANHLIYDAFGRVTSQTDPTLATLFGFTARPFDPATGLQNNLNRWYDAEVGRWLSEDPIGFAAGDANLYRYVENKTTTITDPGGLGSWSDRFWSDYLFYLKNHPLYLTQTRPPSPSLYTQARMVHHARLIINPPVKLKDVDQGQGGWIEMPEWAAMCHRHGEGYEDIRKFCHPEGYEAIFRPLDDETWEYVTHPANLGTFNFVTPEMWGDRSSNWNWLESNGGHLVTDLGPYWIWGNSPNDPTPVLDRIFGPSPQRPTGAVIEGIIIMD